MKNKNTAGILALILGIFGAHRFYLGQYIKGALYILFPPVAALVVAWLTGTVDILKENTTDLGIGFLNRIFFAPIVYYLPVLILAVVEAILFFVRSKEKFDAKFNAQTESSGKVWAFSIVNIALSVLILWLLFNRYFVVQKVDVNSTESKVEISSADLFAAFDNDEEAAYEKYGGQVLTITGPIVEVGQEVATDEYYLGLEGGIIYNVKCNFQPGEQEKLKDLVEGQIVTVKGYCRDLTMDLNIDDCVLLEAGEKPMEPEPEPVTDSLPLETDTL